MYVVDEKKKGIDTPSTNSVASPGPVVNVLDDSARETFATGRPLEDPPDLQVCKHCKKSVLKTATEDHVKRCLDAKRAKLQKKKEAKEARDRERKGLSSKDVDGDGDTKMGSDDEDDEKGPGGLKSSKKSAGKNNGDTKGKKRKADGEGEKGPKMKKKKEEPKPKAPKPKGMRFFEYIGFSFYISGGVGNGGDEDSDSGSVEGERYERHFIKLPYSSSIPYPSDIEETPHLYNPSSPLPFPQNSPSQTHPINNPATRTMNTIHSTRFQRLQRLALLTNNPELITNNSEGPVDVERQCGVLKDGVPCARSLTCKSHSMGAKRAVPGRTLPYDMLLSQYQKKNQAKQQSMYCFVFLFFYSYFVFLGGSGRERRIGGEGMGVEYRESFKKCFFGACLKDMKSCLLFSHS